ncbi:MAG: hypothetical protein L0Y54_23760, partial [Sporichthyaceae bacterium]|nr:hypothetical protein [Sporichthyaceae bacterium]
MGAGSGNEVEIVVKTKDQTGPGAKSVKASLAGVEKAGRDLGTGFDKIGEKVDASEQRILGLKDTVDGFSVIMQGPGQAGVTAYIQGWADLASGIFLFVIPALKFLSLTM